mgnify:FL=1
MKLNELLHSLVLQGHKIPENLHPPLEAEYYSKSKKEYKPVGEMELYHFINAFIQNVDSNEQTQDKTDLSATMSKADIHYELLKIKSSVETLIGGLNDK